MNNSIQIEIDEDEFDDLIKSNWADNIYQTFSGKKY